jgi:hypothetical protein
VGTQPVAVGAADASAPASESLRVSLALERRTLQDSREQSAAVRRLLSRGPERAPRCQSPSRDPPFDPSAGPQLAPGPRTSALLENEYARISRAVDKLEAERGEQSPRPRPPEPADRLAVRASTDPAELFLPDGTSVAHALAVRDLTSHSCASRSRTGTTSSWLTASAEPLPSSGIHRISSQLCPWSRSCPGLGDGPPRRAELRRRLNSQARAAPPCGSRGVRAWLAVPRRRAYLRPRTGLRPRSCPVPPSLRRRCPGPDSALALYRRESCFAAASSRPTTRAWTRLSASWMLASRSRFPSSSTAQRRRDSGWCQTRSRAAGSSWPTTRPSPKTRPWPSTPAVWFLRSLRPTTSWLCPRSVGRAAGPHLGHIRRCWLPPRGRGPLPHQRGPAGTHLPQRDGATVSSV